MSGNQRNPELEYLYSSANLRTLETRLLDESAFDRLIEADSEAELLKQLSARGYDTSAVSSEDAGYADKLVENERAKLFEMIKKILPEPSFFNFFVYPEDYLNIKVLLKASAAGDKPRIKSRLGTVSLKELESAVYSGTAGEGVTRNMHRGIAAAGEAYGLTHDTQFIDLVLDRYCFADMLEAAEKSGITFLKEYVLRLIDTANTKAYFRLKRIGKNADFAAEVFIDGGFAPKKLFIDGYALPTADFIATLPDGVSALAQKCAAEQGGLERIGDDYINDFVKSVKYVPFGAEVAAAYIAAKETEFKNIRIIAAGRAAGLSHAAVKGRLRLYV